VNILIDFDPIDMAKETDAQLLRFSGPEAMLLGRLPLHHKDPFDRMMSAQAITYGLPVMSNNPAFRKYPCKII